MNLKLLVIIVSFTLTSNIALAGVIGSGGVKKIEEKPDFGGANWWMIKCYDGNSKVIGSRPNGYRTWFLFPGLAINSAYKLDGLSLEAVAAKVCE